MNYIAEIIIVRNVNGKTSTETIRKEFSNDSTLKNRRNAIKYLKGLEASLRLAEERGVEEFLERDEVLDFRNFNTVIKSLTCIHSRGTVELINNRFMDDFDQTEVTINALIDEFYGFCQEVINTNIPVQTATVVFETNGTELQAFADDLDWIFEVNGCDVEL